MPGSHEVYKKWRKSSSSAGFMTVLNWPEADRVKIEIADVNPQSNQLISLSTCYIPTIQMLSYLHSEVLGVTQRVYPSLHARGRNHGITFFGGKNIARVFKVESWDFDPSNPDKDVEFSLRRRFKCGEFEISKNARASEPDYSKPINRNSIMMKQDELFDLYHSLTMHQNAFEVAWVLSGLSKEEYIKKITEKAVNE